MNTNQEIKQALENRRQELERRATAISRDRQKEGGPLSGDWQEQAIDLENNEVLDGLDQKTREELGAIRAALGRINDGTYGVCVTCGEDIAAARLNALPFATRCITCAS